MTIKVKIKYENLQNNIKLILSHTFYFQVTLQFYYAVFSVTIVRNLSIGESVRDKLRKQHRQTKICNFAKMQESLSISFNF